MYKNIKKQNNNLTKITIKINFEINNNNIDKINKNKNKNKNNKNKNIKKTKNIKIEKIFLTSILFRFFFGFFVLDKKI